MTRKESYFQIGICPNCPNQTRQRFEFGLNELNGRVTDRGKANIYGEVHTLSLFRCDGCDALLCFRTHYCDFVPADEAEKLDPKWIFDLDDLEGASEFQGDLVYFTRPFQQDPERGIEPSLPEQVPKPVRDIYDEALSVKHSPNSFAVQVGKALEAVQKELDIPKKRLEELESRSSPHGLSQLAIRIKAWRNAAAHYGTPRDNVTAEQAENIDAFFRLIADYVYVLPKKLKEAQDKIEVDVDASVEGIH